MRTASVQEASLVSARLVRAFFCGALPLVWSLGGTKRPLAVGGTSGQVPGFLPFTGYLSRKLRSRAVGPLLDTLQRSLSLTAWGLCAESNQR
jgi:hypothetical protein